jgi:hypothetical protein
MYSYVDEEFAEYVPANEHGFDLPKHREELGVLTHRSLLPVSKCSLKDWAGVPIEALTKYNVSWRGV